MIPALIVQKDKAINFPRFPFSWVATFAIYSGIVPLVLLDLWVQAYQAVYFSLCDIPKIERHAYVIIDRDQLSKLSWLQKLNCVYCGYANGMIAWVKAVINQTEIYSCAIKHRTPSPGQEHQSQFASYETYR